MVLPDKDSYTLDELLKNMPVSMRELARRCGLSEVTIATVRDRKQKTQLKTANKLLNGLSEVYGRVLTMENVTGIDLEHKIAWNRGLQRSSRKQSTGQDDIAEDRD